MKKELPIFIIIFILGFTIYFENSFAEEKETIEIEVKYTNGDIADYNSMKIVVYQDFQKDPILEKKLSSNSDFILVEENHRYKIEVYADGMYADVGYVQVNDKPVKITMNIPLSGGLQFQIFYKNGQVPIKDAIVVLKSFDSSELRRGITNADGETVRYWVQSTTKQGEHYTADIYFEDIFLTSYSPIKLLPGLKNDQKIITNIPEVVESLILINLYDGSKKITSSNGDYDVSLLDIQGNKVISSKVNFRGDAQFSNIKSGTYTVKINSNTISENLLWPETKIQIIGDSNKFNIFRNTETRINNDVISNNTITQEDKIDTCNCIAFRLDDVQDYWLNDVQIAIMETFANKNTPLTIGILANSFGNDQKITEFIKKNTIDSKRNLEIATKGIGLTPFTNLDKSEQNKNLKKSIELIESILNERPKIFIPPNNKFNSDTMEILEENNITHISSSLLNGDSPPFEFSNQIVYRFPLIASTGEYNPTQNIFEWVPIQQTMSEATQGINNYGFSVISLHPQEFSTIENSTYTNVIDDNQINELIKLIDEINEKGYKIVPIGKINSNLIVIVPQWIKNNAGWWADGSIDDKTLVQGIEYLVKEKIIQVNEKSQTSKIEQSIPPWIKNNAGWWADGSIDDKTFVQGIEYLVKNGIILY